MRASNRASARRFAYALATAARHLTTPEGGGAASAGEVGGVGERAPDGAGASAFEGADTGGRSIVGAGAGVSALEGAGASAIGGTIDVTSSGGSAIKRASSDDDESNVGGSDGDGRASCTGTPTTSAVGGVRVRQTHHPNNTPTISAAMAATAHTARDGDGPDAGAPHHLHAPMLRG